MADDRDGPAWETWLAEARVDAAAASRGRERWLRDVAEQEATLTGVLIDLAERGDAIAVTTVEGRRHHGCIDGVGADFVAVRLASGAQALIAMRALAAVRTAPEVPSAIGDRMTPSERRLADAVADLVAERAAALVVARGGETVSGQLRSVGQDVLVVRTDGESAATVYVPLDAVDEVLLR